MKDDTDIIKKRLELFEFNYEPYLRKFDEHSKDGNYVDACIIARDFMFRIVNAKNISDMLKKSQKSEKKVIGVDASVANIRA